MDRKLADAIGSNIVGKCDVTLSRAIQPLTSDVLRVLLFIAYFISLSSAIQVAHVLKKRMKSTCSWRRQLEGTKPVDAKDRVNDYETCESEE